MPPGSHAGSSPSARRRSRLATGTLLALIEPRERERLETDARYNAALTVVDRSLPAAPASPAAPALHDLAPLARLNELWDILSVGPPVTRRGLRSRLAGFVWRLMAPYFERQQAFNAVAVDHLNRTASSERSWLDVTRESQQTAAAFHAALAGFHSQLIQYLQQIAPYVDARDRAVAAQLRAAMDALGAELTGEIWGRPRTRQRRLDAVRQRLALLEHGIAALQQRVASDHAAAEDRTPPTGRPRGCAGS